MQKKPARCSSGATSGSRRPEPVGTILIPGAGWEQIPLIERARKEGWRVVACSPDPHSEALAIADVRAVVDARDLEKLLSVARAEGVSAIVSDQCDYSRYAQAWLSATLGIPGPSIDAVAITTNKRWLREACAAAGVLQPAFQACRSLADVRAAAAEIGLPVIVKPVDNRGSFGVTRVDDEADLAAAWNEAVANAHSREVLVERFVEGVVVTVDGIHLSPGVHRVLGVATKRQTGGRRQVAMEIVYPGELSPAQHALAHTRADAVAKVLSGLGATGLTHTEFIFDGDDFHLVESANRGGGVYTSNVIIPAHSGYDTIGALLAESSGQLPPAAPDTEGAAVILKFFGLPPGSVKSLRGMDDVLASEGVLRGRIYLKPGDRIGEVSNASHRNGFLIVTGADLTDARQRYETALTHLHLEYD